MVSIMSRQVGGAVAATGWTRAAIALLEKLDATYDGCVVIEHEDRGFEGSDEKVKAGFLLARNAVGPYVV